MLIKVKNRVRQNLINIPGWQTSKKIIVFESDDWGAIRMPSKKVYDKLLSKGVEVDKSYYNKNDSLESNNDLDALFSVLRKYKDYKGNHPVFTALSIVANPNFKKIQSNGFTQYEFETVQETLRTYGNSHNNVHKLWEEGINERVFHPEFHGREHLNVNRWMKILKNPDSIARKSFEFNFYGIGQEKDILYLPAFDIDSQDDIESQKKILEEGISIFNEIFRYKPVFFVAPNSLLSTKLEPFLKGKGIGILSGARRQNEPLGGGKFKKNFRYTGKFNEYDQVFTARNSQFEHGHGVQKYGWEKTIKDIETAFFWKKPAVISTHRVNYIGYINEKNRKKGIEQLDNLLNNIIKKWPDVEFMTSTQLGELIRISK